MKRIKQISLDIAVDETVDGVELAEEIANCLEENGYYIAGSAFTEDLTKEYKDYLEQ